MPNSYYSNSTGGTMTSFDTSGYITLTGNATYSGDNGGFTVNVKANGISPQLYFKFVKRKMGLLENKKFSDRIKRLEKAFYTAVENGQSALGEKILQDLARETRESALFARGVKFFIEREDLNKHKRNIRNGHISDTRLENYTRVIPDEVLNAKKKVDGLFDGYVIYHYWNPDEEKVRSGKQKMSEQEKQDMKDPILFGYIKECDRLYFVADWEDEFCDLTFDEIIDVVGKDESEHVLTKYPKFSE